MTSWTYPELFNCNHRLTRAGNGVRRPSRPTVIVAISYANTEHSIFVLLHGDERCQIRREVAGDAITYK